MNTPACRRFLLLVGIVLTSPLCSAALVDLSLEPTAQTVPVNSVGNEFGIMLIATSDGAANQPFVVVDAIIDYDPALLEFLGVDDTDACCSWYFSGFLNEPDGINDDLSDGRFLYSALVQPGSPEDAALPPGTVITTFRFRALAVTPSTVVSFVPSQGSFGETRVLFLPGEDHTGDISASAEVTIEDPGFFRADVNNDGSVDIADPVFILWYLHAGGPTPTCLDAADVNDDGDVDIADPIYELAYLFNFAAAPLPPFPGCGVDPTFDDMGCDSFPGCP